MTLNSLCDFLFLKEKTNGSRLAIWTLACWFSKIKESSLTLDQWFKKNQRTNFSF
jgi:hypothetical protein